MTTLPEFLLARIAEDEQGARAAQAERPRYPHEDTAHGEIVSLGRNEGGSEVAADFIARHNPARVLVECEAKRRIVHAFTEQVEWSHVPWDEPEDRLWPEFGGGYLLGLREAVRALALPYADHPDYRDEWRP